MGPGRRKITRECPGRVYLVPNPHSISVSLISLCLCLSVSLSPVCLSWGEQSRSTISFHSWHSVPLGAVLHIRQGSSRTEPKASGTGSWNTPSPFYVVHLCLVFCHGDAKWWTQSMHAQSAALDPDSLWIALMDSKTKEFLRAETFLVQVTELVRGWGEKGPPKKSQSLLFCGAGWRPAVLTSICCICDLDATGMVIG